MATIVLVGGSGATGRATTAELTRLGHTVRRVDVQDLEALPDVADLVIDLAGPHPRRGREVVAAALDVGAHYLDATLEAEVTADVHAQDARARAAGRCVVSAAGFPAALLDLLAASALAAVDGAREVHLATTFPDRGALRRGAGPGTRAVLARLLTRPVTALVAGRLVDEPWGEARRLAWFPRPVGLAHAAGVPGSAHLSVPRHAPNVETVREYLAVPGWKAELLQLAGNATRWSGSRRWLEARVRADREPAERLREQVRWACVAETRGEQGVARVWANGSDPAGTAAACLVVVAEAILAGEAAPGVRTPAQLAPAAELLDRLSARRDLRWAVIRPAADAT